MAQNSDIEWTDATWNPVVGCEMVSPGCAHCYAETMAKRIKGMALADIAAGKDPGRKRNYIDAINDKGKWSGKLIPVDDALTDPFGWRKPRKVFVNSMSDLFHESVPFEFVDRVFAVMALCPQHTFQILTKRPERMAEWARMRMLTADPVRVSINRDFSELGDHRGAMPWPLPNVWMGCSVENQATADERIPHLLRVPAAVRFLSCEPLLGAINLGIDGDASRLWNGDYNDTSHAILRERATAEKLHWIIIGGESGPGARPTDIAWIRSLVEQCKAAQVPVFVKQLGADPVERCREPITGELFKDGSTRSLCVRDRKGGDMAEWPADLRLRQLPTTERPE